METANKLKYFLTIAILCLAWHCPLGVAPAQAKSPDYQVFAFNDLGMHCYDNDFSIFAILPPFNVVHSQVVQKGAPPRLVDNSEVKVYYKSVASMIPGPHKGKIKSITTTSGLGKTNFWTYLNDLFGVSLPVDVGLLGAQMPGRFGKNTPQPLDAFDGSMKWFTAAGIPITNVDDRFKINPYPMMRIMAYQQPGNVLRDSLDMVVPVSDEFQCGVCHSTGNDAAGMDSPFHGVTADKWSPRPDPLGYRENILILHDAMSGTNLYVDSQANPPQPRLCASCHYSKALDLNNAGPQGSQVGHLPLSLAMHRHHGLPAGAGGQEGVIPIPEPDEGPGVITCYYCHPGNDTQCLRSVMAVSGMTCQNCHGGLPAIGGVTPAGDPAVLGSTGEVRRPWQDLPKCQSCHTGDAVDHLGDAIRQRQAFDANDPAATPIVAVNQRFAENEGQLYRFSKGHGSMACEACHGSPHAEWPARVTGNDNLTAKQIQGHTGPIVECKVCHNQGMTQGLQGPHGLHSVNDRQWVTAHGSFYTQDQQSCKACHGLSLEGTVLSRAAAKRGLPGKLRKRIAIPQGTAVSCALCHGNVYGATP